MQMETEAMKKNKKEKFTNKDLEKRKKRKYKDENKAIKKLKAEEQITDVITVKTNSSKQKNIEELSQEKKTEDNETEVKKKTPSIRQMKKEKALLRAEQAQEENKQKHAKKALNYISKWKYVRSDWKFKKLEQIWLMDNLFNEKYVPDDHFPMILEYFDGCQGIARRTLIDKAMKIIKEVEDNIEEDEEITETTEYKRARKLVQALSIEL